MKDIWEIIKNTAVGDDGKLGIVDKVLWGFVTIVMVLLIAIMATGCKSSRETAAGSSRDTLYHYQSTVDNTDRYKSLYDTTYVKDSIYISMRNDTVTQKEWHTIYKYRNQTDTVYKYHNDADTVYKVRIDSIPYYIEVEKELTGVQEFKLKWFNRLSVLCVICLGVIAWIIWRRMKR